MFKIYNNYLKKIKICVLYAKSLVLLFKSNIFKPEYDIPLQGANYHLNWNKAKKDFTEQ